MDDTIEIKIDPHEDEFHDLINRFKKFFKGTKNDKIEEVKKIIINMIFETFKNGNENEKFNEIFKKIFDKDDIDKIAEMFKKDDKKKVNEIIKKILKIFEDDKVKVTIDNNIIKAFKNGN